MPDLPLRVLALRRGGELFNFLVEEMLSHATVELRDLSFGRVDKRGHLVLAILVLEMISAELFVK